MREPEPCPECGKSTTRIEVDIGVGTQYGPAECFHCGWSEAAEIEELFGSPDEEEE